MEPHALAGPSEAFLDGIPVEVVVEMGRLKLNIGELSAISPDDVLELDQPSHQPLALMVGGRVVARGELVNHNGTLSLQITDVPEA